MNSVVHTLVKIRICTDAQLKCSAPSFHIADFGSDLLGYSSIIQIPLLGSISLQAVGNVLMFALCLPTFISTLFLKDGFRMMKKGLFLVSLTSFLRPLCFCITHLPDADPENITNQYPCVAERNPLHSREGWVPDYPVTIPKAITHTLSILLGSIDFMTSGDMIFSGHTRYLTAALCILSSYVSQMNKKVTVPLFCVGCVMAVLAILTFIRVQMRREVDCRAVYTTRLIFL